MTVVSRHESISGVINKLQRHDFVSLLVLEELDWPWDIGLSDVLKPTQPNAQSNLHRECLVARGNKARLSTVEFALKMTP